VSLSEGRAVLSYPTPTPVIDTMPPGRIDTTRAYKGYGGGGNETIRVGPLQGLVFEYCLYYGRRFQPSHIVNFIVERGFSNGVGRVKLLRYVHWAVKRLLRRGIVRKVAWGLYELVGDFDGYVGKIKPVRVPSSVRNETNGTRVSVVRGGGRDVVGLFLDNLRGYTSSGYVGGDRGAVRGFGDLVFFEHVSYSEFAVGLGTNLLRGLGQVVLYYSCKEAPGVGLVCSDWFEWRPPRGFYKRYGVLEARRVFVNRVVPLVFGLSGRAGVIVKSPFKALVNVVHGLARSLYYRFRRGCSDGV